MHMVQSMWNILLWLKIGILGRSRREDTMAVPDHWMKQVVPKLILDLGSVPPLFQ